MSVKQIEASTDAMKGLTEKQYRDLCQKYPFAPSSEGWVEETRDVLERGAGNFIGRKSTHTLCEKCGLPINGQAAFKLEGYRPFWVRVKIESPEGDWWKWEQHHEAKVHWLHEQCTAGTVGVEKLDKAGPQERLAFKDLVDSETYMVMVSDKDVNTIRILENARIPYRKVGNFVDCDHVVAIDKVQAVDWLMEGQQDVIPLYKRSQE